MDYSHPFLEAGHCPTGYRFLPTDDEVIEHFLLKKVLGRPLTPHLIQELDIFRYDPHQLPRKLRSLFVRLFFFPPFSFDLFDCGFFFFFPVDIYKEAESCGYFFVYGKLGDEEGGGDCVRTTPGGFWKVKGTENVIMDREKRETIGFLRKMVFYRGKAPVGKKTVWVLREYRLNPALRQLKDPHDTKVGLTTLIFVFDFGYLRIDR